VATLFREKGLKDTLGYMFIMGDNKTKMPKEHLKFECEKCQYITNKKYNWEKHVTTVKHLDIIHVSNNFECGACGKKYKDKSGLWRHDKKCSGKHSKLTSFEYVQIASMIEGQQKTINAISDQNKIIFEQNQELLNENKELKAAAKMSGSNNHSHNTTNSHSHNMTNSHNTHFNLQFFLNETCKDAINMKDFIKSIVIELSDLKNVQKVGYTDGMSAIITNALDLLDENKRPIHCSDLKRETMYIKEGDVWEKENEEKSNIKDMIRYVEHKNIKKIPEWVDDNPGCIKGDHKDNTTYLKMVQQVTGGNLQKNDENVDKIIHNIAKTVIIDKNT
jgi:hypothetical protein